MHFDLFVLRFYGPVNPMGSCRARSVYLTTRYTLKITFVTSCLVPYKPHPFGKGSALKGKNLLLWEQFYPFRVDPFLKGGQILSF